MIEKRAVYVITYILTMDNEGLDLQSSIVLAPQVYDHKTGNATHPTDSKLSFKVK